MRREQGWEMAMAIRGQATDDRVSGTGPTGKDSQFRVLLSHLASGAGGGQGGVSQGWFLGSGLGN